jgi:hypothetical protein
MLKVCEDAVIEGSGDLRVISESSHPLQDTEHRAVAGDRCIRRTRPASA